MVCKGAASLAVFVKGKCANAGSMGAHVAMIMRKGMCLCIDHWRFHPGTPQDSQEVPLPILILCFAFFVGVENTCPHWLFPQLLLLTNEFRCLMSFS
jgi:hypothetical protein